MHQTVALPQGTVLHYGCLMKPARMPSIYYLNRIALG